MVDLTSRLKEIRTLINNGDYFIINRARQFGKTTTLSLLQQYLQDEYVVISLDFQGMSEDDFKNEHAFAVAISEAVLTELNSSQDCGLSLSDVCIESFQNVIEKDNAQWGLSKLFQNLQFLCKESDNAIVLMIDEVDRASNNQVFLDFLSQIRKSYLRRNRQPAFQSVILAGVYDVKNLKHKIRPDDSHRYNSPWNIAADFNVDMSFSIQDICAMLQEYEQANKTGMNIPAIAKEIFDYSSGYPTTTLKPEHAICAVQMLLLIIAAANM